MPVKNEQHQVFMNLSEIATRWGITTAAVAKYHVGPGRMPTRRSGQSRLVLVQDLAAYEKIVASDIERRINEDMNRLERLALPIPSLFPTDQEVE